MNAVEGLSMELSASQSLVDIRMVGVWAAARR
jgi:hypothetical protein